MVANALCTIDARDRTGNWGRSGSLEAPALSGRGLGADQGSPAVTAESLPPPVIEPLPATIDLRRHRIREHSDEIARLAAFLPEHERTPLLMVFRENKTTLEVAALLGKPVRQVRKDVRRLVQRVLSEPYRFVVENRDSWPTRRKRVATLIVVYGLRFREASAQSGDSLYALRREMELVRLMSRGVLE